ncbi:uncharacterized protein LOC127812809 [Diospyros lotus]|uniref:uncharacterized protein LOC127812809 n=1 Tax=Diospyros lotus TaxID=55363 RepID=UPI0022523830|nr:uncharacterized protein LOC127812809 [Diospyros lotus]
MPQQHPFKRVRHTNIFVWCVAVVCTVLTILVIIGGIAVFIGYLIERPRVPFISITYTRLDVFNYDGAGILTAKLTIRMKWENDNARAHASFYNAGFLLSLHGLEIAQLVADSFEIPKNSSVEFDYSVESSPIPLDPEQMRQVDSSIKQDLVVFELKGKARTRWRVGIVGSVKFRLRLNCELRFILSNRNSTGSRCSSKTK